MSKPLTEAQLKFCSRYKQFGLADVFTTHVAAVTIKIEGRYLPRNPAQGCNFQHAAKTILAYIFRKYFVSITFALGFIHGLVRCPLQLGEISSVIWE
jgi:hypothetical protein